MSNEYIKKEDVLKFIEDIKCNKDVPKNYGTLLDIMRYIRKCLLMMWTRLLRN